MQSFQHLFAQINLHQPWLMPFLDMHKAFMNTPSADSLAHWLNAYFNQRGISLYQYHTRQPLGFTNQNDLPHGLSYEQFIFENGQIPTRNNLHDWFGACIWSVFGKSKSLLNAKHVANFDNKCRNRLRDTITVFDENGAILVVADTKEGQAIGEGLARFDWQSCLVTPHQAWYNPHQLTDNHQAQVFIFGHALLEQLITPRKALCSHSLIITMPPSFFALTLAQKLHALDERLCHVLDEFLVDGVTPQRLHPLPILGVPHFWQNADPSFYQDTFVFRQGRKNSQQS